MSGDSLQPPGFKFVSGDAETGQIVLTREDGSSESLPIWIYDFPCTMTDNGDGTCTLTV